MSEKPVNGTCNGNNDDGDSNKCNGIKKEVRVWCDGW